MAPIGDYRDVTARSYGRVPDVPFTQTNSDDSSMGTAWVGACQIRPAPLENWWTNWKSQVLYSIAPAFQPGGSAACGTCLTVKLPSGAVVASVRVVAISAGRTLSGQDRSAPAGTVNTNPANYVEFENAVAPDTAFEIRFANATFNDRLAYFPMP